LNKNNGSFSCLLDTAKCGEDQNKAHFLFLARVLWYWVYIGLLGMPTPGKIEAVAFVLTKITAFQSFSITPITTASYR
jgi:hypothetical protein